MLRRCAPPGRLLPLSCSLLLMAQASPMLLRTLCIEDGADFAGGVTGEDQSPYKAELSALALLLRAARRLHLQGTLWVVVDCKSLLDAIAGRGALRSLVLEVSSSVAVLASSGLRVRLEWIPSHGKPLPRHWSALSGASAARLRHLNARADRAAQRHVGRRCQTSARRRCFLAREAAQRWEETVLQAAASTAALWDAR